MTILIFFAVLFVLILVHEWGHFIVAKKTGMRVDEFGIGFPPRIFGWKKGETLYSLNWLPIGGFVRIFGEDAHDAENAGDFERSFVARPKWAQALVLIAGVTMNILFAWLLFVIVFMIGVPTAVDESVASPDADLMVGAVLPDGPAAAAGVPPGAVISELSTEDGASLGTLTPTEFAEFVVAASSTPLTLTYTIGDTTETATVVPEAGLSPDAPDTPVIGVSLALVEMEQASFFEALRDATVTTYNALIAITVGITTLLTDAVQLDADLSNVAGPVGIVGLVGEAAAIGLTSLLLFTATISLNLAVINMLPFPALDGGRLLFVAVEAVTRRRIDPVWVMRLNTIGFILLILLMIAVTANDITRLF